MAGWSYWLKFPGKGRTRAGLLREYEFSDEEECTADKTHTCQEFSKEPSRCHRARGQGPHRWMKERVSTKSAPRLCAHVRMRNEQLRQLRDRRCNHGNRGSGRRSP